MAGFLDAFDALKVILVHSVLSIPEYNWEVTLAHQ